MGELVDTVVWYEENKSEQETTQKIWKGESAAYYPKTPCSWNLGKSTGKV